MEVFILIFLIILNGLFAMSEMSLVSAKKIKLQKYADDGNHAADKALYLSTHNGTFLSTVQVGITIIGIMNGAFGEDIVGKMIEDAISKIDFLHENAHVISTTLFIVGITFTSILFGELIPKQIALRNPEKIAMLMAKPMYIISRILYPFVKILNKSSGFFMRLLGAPPVNEITSEEEINGLMEQGAEAGIFEEHEQDIVSRIFSMDDRSIKSIMTHRSEIAFLDKNASLAAKKAFIFTSRYSRFPICEDNNLDNIIGMIHSKKLLSDENEVDIAKLIEKPLYVPDTLKITQLMHSFRQYKQHLALIVDEYGQLEGLVTMYDVIEALLGDIVAEDIETDPDIIKREDGTYLVDGQISFETLSQIEDISVDASLSDDIHTLGGFIMFKLGKIPRVTDIVETEFHKFEIIDMDKNRIDKVLISKK